MIFFSISKENKNTNCTCLNKDTIKNIRIDYFLSILFPALEKIFTLVYLSYDRLSNVLNNHYDREMFCDRNDM